MALNSESALRVVEILDETELGSASFDTSGELYPFEGMRKPEIYVVFRGNSEWTFTGRLEYLNNTWNGSRTPGIVVSSEDFNVATFDDVLNLLRRWAIQIPRELDATRKLKQEIDDFEKGMEDFINIDPDSEFDPFTEEQRENIGEKLNGWETILASMAEQKEISSEEYAQLQQEIKRLRALLKGSMRGPWLRSFARAMKPLVTSPLAQKLVADVIEKRWLLPPHS